MPTREKEEQLANPVLKFLRGVGCDSLKMELILVDRGIDVFGLSSGPSSRSYAVELKVQNWQKALRQAAIYQLCADYCYVAMPRERAQRLDQEFFRAAGVGLLSVDLDSEHVAILCSARRSAVKQPTYANSLERSVKS
jgi:hypothetical protein